MILGTFLSILKIIGIALLMILLVILALLLIILFVPLRYRAKAVIGRIDLDKLSELSDEGSGDDTDHGLEEAASNDPKSYVLDKIDCKASFSWLLHIVRGGIGYPENTSFWLKVLFFKILPKSEEKKQRKEEKKRRKEEKKSQAKLEKAMDNAGSYEEVSDQSSKDAGNQESLNDQNKSNNKKSSENKTSDISASNIEASDKKDVPGDLDTSDDSDEVNGLNDSEDHADKDSKEHTGSLESDDGNVHKDDSENDHRNDADAEDDNDSEESEDKEDIDIFTFFDFIEKMADLFEKALDFLEKPGEAVEKAFYTISRAYDKMDLIKDLLDSPTFERAFLRAKKDLYLVLRHIMPGKIDADILLGIGDPASMGKLLAGVSVVNTFNDYDIWLEPDFENKVVEASVDIKGRIALWRLLLSAARVYFNKDIRKVRKRFDRIMKK
ncbi:hypothetical protein SAMN04487884_11875 [Butyrivibrio fibrisolvens]|uniref:DUF2953 domain-containing protein n=1 Tax=Butyrivibrio fibrisolvens TaxID=831 RepID=A0A1H9UG73_BUTFI|nr:hypothetical protein [Butyrivibrio fibrisolvens]SES08362.1 hypothetical protein SAMN04487884_11875 [Butyrivibrio fibrisolvens]